MALALMAASWTAPGSAEPAATEVALVYTGEGFTALRGAGDRSEASSFRGLLDMELELPVWTSGPFREGRFLVLGQVGHGRGLNRGPVTTRQGLSAIDGDDFAQLSEYWLELPLAGQALRLRLGKQDANREFAAPSLDAPFVHSSFGMSPTIPIPAYPDPGLGAALLAETGSSTWRLGAFDGGPLGAGSGLEGAFREQRGTVAVAEAGVQARRGRLAASLRAGAWSHSRPLTHDGGGEDPCRAGRGAYALGELNWITDGRARAGAFVQAGWTPSARHEIDRHLGGGLLWYGPSPRRPSDVLGTGLTRARPCADTVAAHDDHGSGWETALELFYRVVLSEHWAVQPDIEIVIGDDDVLAAGVHVEIAF